MRIAVAALAWATLTSMAHAQDARPSAAVIADQRSDAAHPPQLVQTRYLTGGVQVPARWFIAAGPGPHPTMLLLHGFPGTELNLDLARAVQRAGWNVMAIHYRGVWGAPGQFSFNHTIEDARAALVWLRQSARAGQVDTSRIVVLGHSMGGFDTVMIGDDAGVAGFVTISAADMGALLGPLKSLEAREAARSEWEKDTSFTNMSYAAMIDEGLANLRTWDWRRNAAEMARRPVLVIDSNDGLEKDGAAIAAAVSQAGGPAPTRVKFETDHSYNDNRVALASVIIDWLGVTFSERASVP
jgi:acetyl esterase/lipase